MKCVCGYNENYKGTYGKFIALNVLFRDVRPEFSKMVYACPKCGTLKIDI